MSFRVRHSSVNHNDVTVLTFASSSAAMAVYFRYIDLSKCVYPLYANGLGEAVAGKKVQGLTQTAEEAFAIRAATLAACERVVELIPEVAEATGKEWLKKITVIDM